MELKYSVRLCGHVLTGDALLWCNIGFVIMYKAARQCIIAVMSYHMKFTNFSYKMTMAFNTMFVGYRQDRLAPPLTSAPAFKVQHKLQYIHQAQYFH